jgi:hypothetical protein
MKFKVGDKVRLLDKTCGPIHGLRRCLTKKYENSDGFIPMFGTIKSAGKSSHQYGDHYKVQVDNYDHNIYRHREFMFYEDDLILLLQDWFEDELFVI